MGIDFYIYDKRTFYLYVFRQCMCCYREIKNFDRFIRLTQSVVLCTLQQLQVTQQNEQQVNVEKETSKDEKEEEKTEGGKLDDSDFAQRETQTKQNWSQQDREKLLHLLSKIFLLNFPLYIAMKHGGAINPLAPVKVIAYFRYCHQCFHFVYKRTLIFILFKGRRRIL